MTFNFARALLSLTFSIPIALSAATLPLEEFLSQVQDKNQSVSASKLIIEGAELKASEGKLLFRTNIFAQAQTALDKKPTNNIAAQGDQTDYTFFTAGLSQQFSSGLQGKLSYNFSHTKIHDASPNFVPLSDFHDGIANLELSQSLWRNWAGKESRSQESILIAQSKASKLAESFKIKAILAQAESLYWSLSQTQKIVKVQKESLERAMKIKNWNQNRLKSGLAESSDFLQSDANYKAREYELKSSLQELKNITRAFNSVRGINSEEFDAQLESIDAAKIKSLTLPQKVDLREDTKAALEIQNISKASAEISMEKNKPTLELYGSYALNGRNAQGANAVSNSLKTNHDTKVVGIRFVTPLDFNTTTDNISGYKKDQLAAEQNYQRKLFEQDQQWSDLSAKFEDAKIKLSLIEKIEEAQKIKANNERDRLNKGRTVTFQVLNFEQDYAQSELERIQSETNILNIYSQLKTFVDGGTK